MIALYIAIASLISLGIGGGVTFFVTKTLSKNKLGKAESAAKQLIEKAKLEAEALKKGSLLEAKDEILRQKTEANKEIAEQKSEINKQQNRLQQKEENLDRRDDALEKKMFALDETRDRLEKKQAEIVKLEGEFKTKQAEIQKELEKVAKLSKEEAKQQLIKSIETEARKDAGILVREIEAEARETAGKEAKNIVALAIQKCATDHTAEITVSSVSLPNDEMKGRIIGREGRNITAIEAATGVELIVDDTPETITVSCFDPIRREVARLTLEKLIADGRIHPARIEEIVEKVKRDIEHTIKDVGENATFEAGVYGLHPELMKLIGRLKYRTSYGQNCLKHSLETSFIAGLLAGELGVDETLAKRAGLLHDIGKAVDFEMEGTHTQIGVDLARKYKESEAVVHCIEAHHGGVEYKSIEAILVQVADAISSSRPGARKESMEAYVKRLKQLEGIANSYPGVATSYAIQAGREVRVIVKPEAVNDDGIIILAKDIAKRIEGEMQYPGQIKVNVIRESRATDIAT